MNKFPVTFVEVDINAVFPNSWNPNNHKSEIFKKLVDNVKAFGQIDPVLVRPKEDETFEIIDGEHRWHAARELGYTKIQIGILKGIDDSTAKVLTLNMNNLRGTDDVLKRAKMLKEMNEGQLALLPYTKEEIEQEISLLSFDFSKFDKANADDIKDDDISKDTARIALTFYNNCMKLHDASKDVDFKLLLEQFFDWYRVFISKLS